MNRVRALNLAQLILACGCATPAPGTGGRPGVDAGPPVLVAAGDIAGVWEADEATAKLVESIAPASVLLLGDNAYFNGADDEFADWYAPTWGRFRNKTLPVAGNHDHATKDLAGYCGYFGPAAQCKSGESYYAMDVGPWRLIVLDSGCNPTTDCNPMASGSAMMTWLASELEGQKRRCTLAAWHHPRYSTGAHGNDARSNLAWAMLADAGVDVVLTGHDHNYERFVPLGADGVRDDAAGITQFVVGTGGATLRKFDKAASPNTAVRRDDAYGVLKLVLSEGAAEFSMMTTGDAGVVDQGRIDCH